MAGSDSDSSISNLYMPSALDGAHSWRLLVKGLPLALLVIICMAVSFWFGFTVLESPQLTIIQGLYDIFGPFFNNINRLLPHVRLSPGISPAVIISILLLLIANQISFFFFQQLMVEKYALTNQGLRAARVIYLLALLMMFAGIVTKLSAPKEPQLTAQASIKGKQAVAGISTQQENQLPAEILIDSILVLGVFSLAKGIDSLPNKQSKVDYSEFRTHLLAALDQLEQGVDDCISSRDALRIDRVIVDLESARGILKKNYGKEPQRYQRFVAEHLENNILELKQFLIDCQDGKEELICDLYQENYTHPIATNGNRAFRSLETLMRKG